MGKLSERFEKNAEGRYYVDESCIYCDLCREMAPTVFAEDKESGVAYVFKQPETKEEHELARQSLEGCPTESIGDMENLGIETVCHEPDGSQSEPERKWWQFWKS